MANTKPVTIDGKTGKPVTPHPVRTAPIKLNNLRSIRDELARLYRLARAGKIETQDATRLAYLLSELRQMTIAIEIEDRLVKLEEGRDDEKH